MRYVDTGVLYCGDNLERLRHFPDECVDLIYLDPPFFSNKTYEVIWGDEAEVRSFEDRWEGGINHYVGWIRDRVMQMHRVLKPTGTFYLHCDWHAGHYLKVMLDGIFGYSNFRNEIARCYAGGGVPKKDFPRKHDTIFRYTKTKDYFFAPMYRPYSEGTMQRGRTAVKGKYAEQGLRKEGTPINDWWADVPKITSPTDPEKLGYPTQKSEALLERIIATSSEKEAVVLDPFCGCGTTVAVAERLDRRWIGVDISPTAVNIMRARLGKLSGTARAAEITVVGVPTSENELRKLKPFEFQNWVIQRVDGVHSPRKTGDMGIDGFSFLEHAPIQIKRSDKVGRNVVDNFETAVERHGATHGYIVAFSFTSGARDEAARVKTAKGLEIELVTVKQLLLGTSMLVAPVLNRSVVELPLPAARPKNARPTAEELIESDEDSEEVA